MIIYTSLYNYPFASRMSTFLFEDGEREGMAGVIRRGSQKKKQDIVDITTRLLLEKGGSAVTSTTDICEAARLTRPSLYNFFGSKQNLMLSVHVEHLDKTLKPYLEEAKGIRAPEDRLKFMVRSFVTEIICKHPELRVLIHDSLTMNDNDFKDVKGAWKEHYVLLRDTIAQLKTAGTINGDVVPSWAALFVLGMLTWVLYWFNYERRTQIDQVADQALLLVQGGLGMKSGKRL
jgi:TetR/AcrR family transcriptional regulator, cholesterol catabolism regulator